VKRCQADAAYNLLYDCTSAPFGGGKAWKAAYLNLLLSTHVGAIYAINENILLSPVHFMPHLSARTHSLKSTCSVRCHTTIQYHYGLYYWYCSLDMHDGANCPILVPQALRMCQAVYEDAKGLIIVATMV